MSDERIDLTPLDPAQDPDRFESTVESILAAAGPALARRRARETVVGQVALWWRPLLAAAAIAGIVAAAALARVPGTTPETDVDSGLAEAIGVPDELAQWVRSEDRPTPLELLAALEESR